MEKLKIHQNTDNRTRTDFELTMENRTAINMIIETLTQIQNRITALERRTSP